MICDTDTLETREPHTELGVAALYLSHSKWLASRLRHRAGDEQIADVVQETYARLSRYPNGTVFRHPKALLLKIASNILHELARKNRGAVQTQLPDDYHQSAASSVGSDQFESILLKQIIEALPRANRDVFILSRIGGLSYEEIAQKTGLSMKAVEWRLSKALALCAAQLHD
jgi:RNA polymerase sigma-70 factor (ECF subfamily)